MAIRLPAGRDDPGEEYVGQGMTVDVGELSKNAWSRSDVAGIARRAERGRYFFKSGDRWGESAGIFDALVIRVRLRTLTPVSEPKKPGSEDGPQPPVVFWGEEADEETFGLTENGNGEPALGADEIEAWAWV